MAKHDFYKPNEGYYYSPRHKENNNNYVETLDDYGPSPIVFNMQELSSLNQNFRIALWTGNNFQLTLMNIKPNEDIGMEMHEDVDQFFKIESGTGRVVIKPSTNSDSYEHPVSSGSVVIVPAGFWHNIINTGTEQLKLFSIYAPPEHKYKTVHITKPR